MIQRKVTFTLGILGLFLGTFLLYYLTHRENKIVYEKLPPIKPYEHSVAANGIIEATHDNISVGVPVAAIVKEVDVKVWEKVKKGQPLFKLDDRELQSELNVENANVEVAEKQLVRLKDQLDRLKSAKDPRSISQEELKNRINEVAVAETQLKAAKAQQQNKIDMIDRLTIRAPRDGIILQSNIRPGEYVSLTPPSPPILLGTDLDNLQIRVDVDEQNAYKIKPDLPATAFPKNNTTLAIPLHFSRIEPYVIPKKSLTGLSDEKVDIRVLQVIYTFEPPKNFPLYIGQQVDVFIETKEPS